ncbi:helix-turn-helix transcriptional regulator [Sinorhizobium meliloti]|uniref:helix-turn-helix transcriptional regulator n=1 Tax=Rhizobium meliloti TaxID=382 RepID=UPI00244DD824|nr:helix-turn-helix transcriptional regulator [Sinorhizobium meliloti]WGI73342.1 helix-turn-helix transcriptional regulator [Sinorhizobium meliloti]
MHFAAGFLSATGSSPHAYVRDRRITRAKARLMSDPSCIEEIALDVGFRSETHFITVFRQITGHPPAGGGDVSSGSVERYSVSKVVMRVASRTRSLTGEQWSLAELLRRSAAVNPRSRTRQARGSLPREGAGSFPVSGGAVMGAPSRA